MFFLAVRLYLIEILHQTTTCGWRRLLTSGCILSKFYIKPQQTHARIRRYQVVSYRNSTSNHNMIVEAIGKEYVVSYRNSTSNHNELPCLLCFYMLYLIEILHQTTTAREVIQSLRLLYLIEILHQTTTFNFRPKASPMLYLIEILHQTTTCQTPEKKRV